MKKGEKYKIHGYKHNGKLYKTWDEAVLLDIKKNYLVFGNNKTLVRESEGITWRTKEPAIMYFFKDKWYNVIAQMKPDGIYYYCNIATPFIIEEGTIKYIDYDLDLRVFPDGAFKILDRGEYKYHKAKMNYPEEIDKIVKDDLSKLISLARERQNPFNVMVIDDYYYKYNKLKKVASE